MSKPPGSAIRNSQTGWEAAMKSEASAPDKKSFSGLQQLAHFPFFAQLSASCQCQKKTSDRCSAAELSCHLVLRASWQEVDKDSCFHWLITMLETSVATCQPTNPKSVGSNYPPAI